MTKRKTPSGEECPVVRAVDAIGDRWSLMILRDAFDGIRRFGEFQKSLGLAKNILAGRLRSLVALGVFEIKPASDGSAYREYVLSSKGRSLFPLMISLRQWGEANLFGKGEVHSVLIDSQSKRPPQRLAVRAGDGRLLDPADCYRRKVVKRG